MTTTSVTTSRADLILGASPETDLSPTASAPPSPQDSKSALAATTAEELFIRFSDEVPGEDSESEECKERQQEYAAFAAFMEDPRNFLDKIGKRAPEEASLPNLKEMFGNGEHEKAYTLYKKYCIYPGGPCVKDDLATEAPLLLEMVDHFRSVGDYQKILDIYGYIPGDHKCFEPLILELFNACCEAAKGDGSSLPENVKASLVASVQIPDNLDERERRDYPLPRKPIPYRLLFKAADISKDVRSPEKRQQCWDTLWEMVIVPGDWQQTAKNIGTLKERWTTFHIPFAPKDWKKDLEMRLAQQKAELGSHREAVDGLKRMGIYQGYDLDVIRFGQAPFMKGQDEAVSSLLSRVCCAVMYDYLSTNLTRDDEELLAYDVPSSDVLDHYALTFLEELGEEFYTKTAQEVKDCLTEQLLKPEVVHAYVQVLSNMRLHIPSIKRSIDLDGEVVQHPQAILFALNKVDFPKTIIREAAYYCLARAAFLGQQIGSMKEIFAAFNKEYRKSVHFGDLLEIAFFYELRHAQTALGCALEQSKLFALFQSTALCSPAAQSALMSGSTAYFTELLAPFGLDQEVVQGFVLQLQNAKPALAQDAGTAILYAIEESELQQAIEGTLTSSVALQVAISNYNWDALAPFLLPFNLGSAARDSFCNKLKEAASMEAREVVMEGLRLVVEQMMPEGTAVPADLSSLYQALRQKLLPTTATGMAAAVEAVLRKVNGPIVEGVFALPDREVPKRILEVIQNWVDVTVSS